MPKDSIRGEIKRIPVDIEAKSLGMVEIADLAASVEKYMAELQEEGDIDTLKQALMAALHFAAKAYLQTQNEGGKRQEEESRVNDLIAKLQTALDASQK